MRSTDEWASLPGLAPRQAAPADTGSIVAVMNACAREVEGTPTTGEQYAESLTALGIDPALDRRVVATPEGIIAGYGQVVSRRGYARYNASVYVLPQCRGRGIGTYLTRWAEDRARQLATLAPEGAQVILACSIDSAQQDAKEVLCARGFALVRHFLEMRVEMREPPPGAVWPEAIAVRTLIEGQDERAVYMAIEEAFADHWGHVPIPCEEGFPRFVQRNRSESWYDPSLWFLAMDGYEIAGYALCGVVTSQSPILGWVRNLGVRRPWRRRGVATALLRHSLGVLCRRGIHAVGLKVDAESRTGATGLYERAGMRVWRAQEVWHKELGQALGGR